MPFPLEDKHSRSSGHPQTYRHVIGVQNATSYSEKLYLIKKLRGSFQRTLATLTELNPKHKHNQKQ